LLASNTIAKSPCLFTRIAVTSVIVNSDVHGQVLAPRADADVPVGLNFLLSGYQYFSAAVLSDPAVPITDADCRR
jgi:hypothetical protein